METSLTDLQYESLLKVHQCLYHCGGWDWYLKLHSPKREREFTALFDLLCMLNNNNEIIVLQTLKRRFQQLSLITTIEYVKEKLEQLNAPPDFQVFMINRMSECEFNSLQQIQWQKPSRATAPEIAAHYYAWSSVITTQLSLESKLEKQYFIATECVSTKDFFAITHAANEWPYTYEPWLPWFLYLQTTDLYEMQTWSAYRTYTIDLLMHYRSNSTMLFDLYLQVLALIWPTTAVPIPDLSALRAAAAEA